MADSEKIRILVVDDHHISRSGLVMILGQCEKLSVIGEAADGRAAVEMALSLRPEVILMDLTMPIMDGIEATAEIKAKLPATRIIVLTANDSDNDIFAALAAGADGYCLKDIGAEQLHVAVMAVNAGASYLHPSIAQRVLRTLTKPKTADKGEFGLSEREMEVLKLIVDGVGNQQIAAQLFISTDTVKSHVRNILDKLAVADRTQAAVKAVRQGLA